jgi:hypothetical protein
MIRGKPQIWAKRGRHQILLRIFAGGLGLPVGAL